MTTGQESAVVIPGNHGTPTTMPGNNELTTLSAGIHEAFNATPSDECATDTSDNHERNT